MPDANSNETAEGVQPNGLPEKTTLVYFRNGKLVLKQKLLSFGKMSETMQEIVKFRDVAEKRAEKNEGPLASVPTEHRPLIAKLVHESEKTLQALSKHIQSELSPAVDEDDEEEGSKATAALTMEAVEQAIKYVATRNNYGLDSVSGDRKIPSALLVWRWEVKDEFMGWLPKAAKEKVEARLAERRQAKKDAQALFEAMSEEEQNKLLGSKGPSKASGKLKTAKVSERTATPDAPRAEEQSGSQPANSDIKTSDVAEALGSTPRKSGRPKRSADAEKADKEKEKQEKKAAKEEKEKKAKESQAKARSLMASFFNKGKPPTNRTSSFTNQDSGSSAAGPSKQISEFEKTFKPFVLKKDAELAPANWFQYARKVPRKGKQRAGPEVIVLDDGPDMKQEDSADIVMKDVQVDVDVNHMSEQERLQNTLSLLSPRLHPTRRLQTRSSPWRLQPRYCVRSIIAELNEAEVAGDDSRVRSLLATLRNRTLVPAKVLIFHEDARPGYFGTWTRSSKEIGPRTPFAKDIITLDYTYDSGEEWEEEDAGEADDVVDDADEDDDEERDSDLDSWLIDDDEVEEPGTPIEERAGSPGMFPNDVPLPLPKRKANDEEHKGPKKRKVVIPLVAFTKGPCWESRIGQPEYEPFRPYQIQLLNDTPFPIDPFKFVSTVSESEVSKSLWHTSNAGFAVPALPARTEPKVSPTPVATASSSAAASTPKARPMPKTPFPDAHIPLLLERISSLATSSLPFIVETVHNELREHRVKKNAIEAKVREVGEKCKEKKVWVVKQDVKALHGLA